MCRQVCIYMYVYNYMYSTSLLAYTCRCINVLAMTNFFVNYFSSDRFDLNNSFFFISCPTTLYFIKWSTDGSKLFFTPEQSKPINKIRRFNHLCEKQTVNVYASLLAHCRCRILTFESYVGRIGNKVFTFLLRVHTNVFVCTTTYTSASTQIVHVWELVPWVPINTERGSPTSCAVTSLGNVT